MQTQAGADAARRGTIRPTRSGDYHIHLSYETAYANEYSGAPLLQRFVDNQQGDEPPVEVKQFEKLLKDSEVGMKWKPGLPGTGPGPRGGIRFGDTWGWTIGSILTLRSQIDEINRKLDASNHAAAALKLRRDPRGTVGRIKLTSPQRRSDVKA